MERGLGTTSDLRVRLLSNSVASSPGVTPYSTAAAHAITTANLSTNPVRVSQARGRHQADHSFSLICL